jgi:hypothetical protein
MKRNRTAATATSAKWRQERTEKFRILHRDNFTCRYCDAKPGSEFLEVDHLIPRSLGGSDDQANLVAACVTCNRRKSNTIFLPPSMVEGPDDEDGWSIHKTFGVFAVKFSDAQVVIEANWGYWFPAWWVHDHEKWQHIHDKEWPKEWMRDLYECANYVGLLVARDADEEAEYDDD